MAFQSLIPGWRQIFLTLQDLEGYSSTLRQVLEECANLQPGEVFQPASAVRRILKIGASMADKCILLDAILSVAIPGNPYHRKSSQMVRWHVDAILAILSTKLNDEDPTDEGRYLARLAETCGYDISALILPKLASAHFQTLIGFVLEYGNDNAIHTTHVQERHLQYPLDVIWCDMQANITELGLDEEEIYHLLQLTKKHSQVSLTQAFNILLQSTASIEDSDVFRQVLLPLIDLLLSEDLPAGILRQSAPLFSVDFLTGQVSYLDNELFQAVSSFIYHMLTRFLRLSMPPYPQSIPNVDIDWSIEAFGCGCNDCNAISFYLSYPGPKGVRLDNITNFDMVHVVDYFRGSTNIDGTVVCDVQYDNIHWPFTVTFSKKAIPDEATLRQRLRNSADAVNQQMEDWNAWYATTQRMIRRIDDGIENGRKRRLYPFLRQHYEAVISCNPTRLPYNPSGHQGKPLRKPGLPRLTGPPARLLSNLQASSRQGSPQPQPYPLAPPNTPLRADIDMSDSAESRPELFQVHRSHILPETLDYYQISWRPNLNSNDYIIIEEQIPEATLLDMFSHTQRIYNRVNDVLEADGYGKF